jgi:hypothetical protein
MLNKRNEALKTKHVLKASDALKSTRDGNKTITGSK